MKLSLNLFILIIATMVMRLEAKISDPHCGACHMLVEEISWGISQTDPKRTIQVGSFRIMPDGSQKLNEIPYKQSAVQISELLDTACAKPNDYIQSTDEATGRTIYQLQNRRDGKPAALKNVKISKESTKMLKFACEGIAEDFDEEITNAFKNKDDSNYLNTVCVEIAEVCLEEHLYDVNPDVAAEGEDSEQEDSDEEDSKENSVDDSEVNNENESDNINNKSEL